MNVDLQTQPRQLGIKASICVFKEYMWIHILIDPYRKQLLLLFFIIFIFTRISINYNCCISTWPSSWCSCHFCCCWIHRNSCCLLTWYFTRFCRSNLSRHFDCCCFIRWLFRGWGFHWSGFVGAFSRLLCWCCCGWWLCWSLCDLLCCCCCSFWSCFLSDCSRRCSGWWGYWWQQIKWK